MQELEQLQELLKDLSEKEQCVEILLRDVETVRADVQVLKQRLRETLQREMETHRTALQTLTGNEQAINGDVPLPEMILSILKAHGTPLHVSEIRNDLKRRYNKEVTRQKLESLLYRYAKRGRNFYKVYGRPNSYGLLEWQGRSGRKATNWAR
jgi:DNA repair exonuclease SbcCD ATPase subunit